MKILFSSAVLFSKSEQHKYESFADLRTISSQAASFFQNPMVFQNPPPRFGPQHHMMMLRPDQHLMRPGLQPHFQANQDFRRNYNPPGGKNTHVKVNQVIIVELFLKITKTLLCDRGLNRLRPSTKDHVSASLATTVGGFLKNHF